MNFRSLTRSILRALVYHYCRRSPVRTGKMKLVFVTRRAEVRLVVEAALPGGGKIMADLSDVVQRLIYFLGYYERGVTKLISQTLRPGDNFVDIGAHVGYYTLIASPLVGQLGSVHSFEPVPEVFTSLRENVELNGLTNVRLNQTAVFDETRELEIFLPVPGNSGTATFFKRPNATGSSIYCPATSLDSYVRRKEIDSIRLIKMDIEGAEPIALRGMSDILSSPNPPDLICEAVPYLLEFSGHKQADVIQIMESFGYRGQQITDNGLCGLEHIRHLSPVAECNLYFTCHTT